MANTRRRLRRVALLPAVAVALVLAGCGGTTTDGVASPGSPVPAETRAAPADSQTLEARLAAIDDAVNRWRAATDLAGAHRAAEEVRNLVVGPAGPGYGDADGNGTIEGVTDIGLLPGMAGEPGLATATAGACVERDVLGGGWADPAQRWSILQTAIEDWSATNNTFPSLPSHPQRIVGWATLALATDDLAAALEYGGHAHIHIDVAMNAATACP